MRHPAGGALWVGTAAAMLALLLAACGSSGSNGYGLAAPQSASPSSATSQRPSPVEPSPSQPSASAPQQTQAPAAAAPPAPMSFALTPVMGATGSVTIAVTSDSTFMVTVVANGLAPGSTHAVHLHFGNCPSAGVHIIALNGLTANGAGSGSSTTTIRMAYKGDGRFVIVYAGPSPGPLAACAQLSG